MMTDPTSTPVARATPRGDRAPLVVAASGVAIVLLAYLPSLRCGFVFDDFPYVIENMQLRGIPLARFWQLATTRTNPWEHLPVRDLSLRIDIALFNDWAVGYHVHNLVLYAAVCAVAWAFVRALSRLLLTAGADAERQSAWLATAATLLFAAHPAHVESVAWVSGRKDLLFGLFGLGSLFAFVRALGAAQVAWRWHMGAGGLLVLALFSRSAAVALPAAALLIALASYGRRGPEPALRASAAAVAPLALLGAIGLALHVAVGRSTGIAGASDSQSFGVAPGAAELALLILGTLSRVAAVPIDLRLIYDLGESGMQRALAAGLGIAAAAAVGVGAWRATRLGSPAGAGLALAGVLVLPFLQLVPFQTWSLASERFLFLPLVGVSFAIAAGAAALGARSGALMVAALFTGWAAQTELRAEDWADSDRLIETTARLSPGDALAVTPFVMLLLAKGQRLDEAAAAAAGVRHPNTRRFLSDYIDARVAYDRKDIVRAAALLPDLVRGAPPRDPNTLLPLANMALELQLNDAAELGFRRIVAERPGFPVARYNLGLALMRQGRHAEAAVELRGAVDEGTRSADVWNNLGLALRDAGRPTDAVDAFKGALAAEPLHWHAAFNLARLELSRGRPDAARATLAVARERAVAAGAITVPIDELERLLDGRAANPSTGQPPAGSPSDTAEQ